MERCVQHGGILNFSWMVQYLPNGRPWQKTSGFSKKPVHTAGPCFAAFLAAQCGHMTESSSVECGQKWWEPLLGMHPPNLPHTILHAQVFLKTCCWRQQNLRQPGSPNWYLDQISSHYSFPPWSHLSIVCEQQTNFSCVWAIIGFFDLYICS